MALERSSVGIDIGSHSLKLVELRVGEGGAFIRQALYYDRGLLAQRGVSLDDSLAVAALLRSDMAERGIRGSGVSLAISGADSILRYTSLPPVPSWRLKVIMDLEVKEVEERIGEKLASDYRVLPIRRESNEEQVVLVGLAKEAALEKLLGGLEGAGITVERAVPAPLALLNAWEAFGSAAPTGDEVDADEEAADELEILLDVGHSNSHLVLVLNGRMLFARSASFGGEAFTEALARDLGLDAPRAENLKLRQGTLSLEIAQRSERESQIVNSLRGVAAQLQNFVQSALRQCKQQTGREPPEPARLVLVGGGMRLAGLADYLKQSFRRPSMGFQPRGLIVAEGVGEAARRALANDPGDFAVAIGLAAGALRQGGFSLSIVPQRYRERRHFRERTVVLYAAGGLLAAALVLGGVKGWLQRSAVASLRADYQAEVDRLSGQMKEMEQNAERNRAVRERVNRILREVEISAFQSAVADHLRHALRPEIRLTRVQLHREIDNEETDVAYTLVIDGLADNSNRQGLSFIEELRQRLAAEPQVRGVEIRDSQQSGNAYQFTMTVSPAFQSYQG